MYILLYQIEENFKVLGTNHIIEQLDYFHSLIKIYYCTEMFVLNKNHFMKLCELIIDRGYDFNIYSSVELLKEKYLDTLKKDIELYWYRKW